ncbi:hypothetical protein pb186bvf_007374 [Paramecium bursaria]
MNTGQKTMIYQFQNYINILNLVIRFCQIGLIYRIYSINEKQNIFLQFLYTFYYLMQNQKPRELCLDFQKDRCFKQNCELEHKYVPCSDYDKGFCHQGPHCTKKHIVRKLCLDYMYGFCRDGPECKLQHVKLYEQNDATGELKFTERYYQKLKKEYGYYKDAGEFKPVICKSCQEVGHKCNPCKRNMRLSPNKIIYCGICDQEHSIIEQGRRPNCQYNRPK